MKKILFLLILHASLAAQDFTPFFFPREDHPFYLFSPSGSLSIEDSEGLWPQVLKIRTSGDGGNVQIVAQDLPLFSLETERFVLWIKVRNLEKLKDLWIYSAEDNDFSKRIVFMISQDKTQLVEGEWVRVSLPLSSGQVWGDPDIGKLQSFQIWASDDGSGVVDIEIGPITLEQNERDAAVVFTFDDGWSSQIRTAAPILEKYGMKGTAFIIPELIGTPGYMEAGDLSVLRDEYGWSIGSHYMERMDGLSTAEVRSVFEDQERWFGEQGLVLSDFSYPNGAFGPVLLGIVPEYFRSARTIIEFPESLPPGDAYKLRTLNIVPGISSDRILRRLESVRDHGGLLILIFHKIEEDPQYETEISAERFEEVCRFVADAGLPVFTMAELSQSFIKNSTTLNANWDASTVLQPVIPEESGLVSSPPAVETEGNPLEVEGMGRPEWTSGTQIDFSLDWRMAWGVKDSDDAGPGEKGDPQFYNQLDDLHIYIQKDLSDSAHLFGAVGIEDVNFSDFSEGAIDGSYFYLNSLYLEQELFKGLSFSGGYFSPDPVHKWLQVTRSAGIEPALGQDMTPKSLWLSGKWDAPGPMGIQAALVPDVIGVESESGLKVQTYQESLGVPNVFGSVWYNMDRAEAELAAAWNGDALKIASAGGVYHDFQSVRLSASLGYKYTRGSDFSTYPEWDHLDKASRISTGWSLSVPFSDGWIWNPGVAYLQVHYPDGEVAHRMGIDVGFLYKILELYAVFTTYDLTDNYWGNTLGMESGLIVDYQGVEYMIGYTMAGFNTLSGLYNNKPWNEGGVNGLFVRIKATYW